MPNLKCSECGTVFRIVPWSNELLMGTCPNPNCRKYKNPISISLMDSPRARELLKTQEGDHTRVKMNRVPGKGSVGGH
jgi:predicted  nucleic acid-binding Zn-ribbon protein